MLPLFFKAQSFQLLLYLVTSSAQLLFHQPPGASNSGTLLNMARTVLNTFSSCQLALVKNSYKVRLPDLGEMIAQEATGPVLILDTLFYLKPQVKIEFLDKGGTLSILRTYNVRHTKYQSQQRVYLSFPRPDEAGELIPPEPVFYGTPDGGYGMSKGVVDAKEDIVVNLVDMRLEWSKNKYEHVRLIHFFCHIPTHTIMVEYFSQDPNDRLKVTAFYVHLRCPEGPTCIQTFAETASELRVKSVKTSVRKSQGNFEKFPIFVGMQAGLVPPFSWSRLGYWARRIWRKKLQVRAAADILMPLLVLANKLNQEARLRDSCACGQVFHGLYKYNLRNDQLAHPSFLLKTGGHMLICGAPKESHNPFTFNSLRHLFPIYIWLIILIAAALMSICLAVRTGSSAFGSSLIGTLTPLVNQISEPGGASGQFWFAFWVLSILFLSNWYLG